MRAPENPLRALFWMVGSAISFTLMSLLVKHLSRIGFSQNELVFYRSFVAMLVSGAAMALYRENFLPPGRNLLFFRGVFGFIAVTAYFYSLGHLPLSIAALLNWLSPIFVLFFSRVFTQERLPRGTLPKIALAFLGLVFVLKIDWRTGLMAVAPTAVLIGLCGSASAGLAYVAVRAATARFSIHAIVFYFSVVATAFSAPLALMSLSSQAPQAFEIIELLGLGLSALAGQYAMTQGYRHAMAGLVSSMNLLNAVFATLLGWFLFGEVLAPLQILGIGLVCLGVASVSWNPASK